MGVEASIIVKFEDGEEDTSSVVVELDDDHEDNQDAEGNAKSSFDPTDTPVFLIHHPDDVAINSVRCTHGSVEQIRTNVSRNRNVDQLFTDLDTKNDIQYSNIVLGSSEWFGNSGVAYVDGGVIKISSGTFPCYANLVYRVLFDRQYRLTPPELDLAEDETYTIYVVIYVRKIYG